MLLDNKFYMLEISVKLLLLVVILITIMVRLKMLFENDLRIASMAPRPLTNKDKSKKYD